MERLKVEAMVKQKMIDGFVYRIKNEPFFLDKEKRPIFNIPLKLWNGDLYAESAMIFYCQHCGWPSDIKHEQYLSTPNVICGDCKLLEKEGHLQEAKNTAGIKNE